MCVYVCVCVCVHNGENTSKSYNNSHLVSVVVVFKGHNSKCHLQQDVILFDVSWLMYVRFLVHMQKEESKVNFAGTA